MIVLNLHPILDRPFFGEIVFSSCPSAPLLCTVENFQQGNTRGNTSSFIPLTKGSDLSECCRLELTLHLPLPTLSTFPCTCHIPMCRDQGSPLKTAAEVARFLCLHYWWFSWVGCVCALGQVGTKVLTQAKSRCKPDCGCTYTALACVSLIKVKEKGQMKQKF